MTVMRSNSWTAEEEEWLREVYPDTMNSRIAEMHAERFPDRPRRTLSAVRTRAKSMRLRKSDGFVRNPPTLWTPERVEWLGAFTPGHSAAETADAFEREFGERMTVKAVKNAKARLGLRSGTVGGRFEKGKPSWNRGLKWEEYMSPEGQAASSGAWYRKGNIPHNAAGKPVGYERVSKDGYVEVKVKDGIQGEANDNFRMKHRVVWEEHNGPIPPNAMIVFADHDKRNFDPSNLVAVPRDLWAVISHRHLEYWDADSLRTCMRIAEVDRARYAAQCRPRKCKRCGETFKPRYAHHRTCGKCLGR